MKHISYVVLLKRRNKQTKTKKPRKKFYKNILTIFVVVSQSTNLIKKY